MIIDGMRRTYNRLANTRDDMTRMAKELRSSTFNGDKARRDKVSIENRAVANALDSFAREITETMVQGLNSIPSLALAEDLMYLVVAAYGRDGKMMDVAPWIGKYPDGAIRDNARETFWRHYGQRYPKAGDTAMK